MEMNDERRPVSRNAGKHGLFRSYFSRNVEKLLPLRNRKSITSRNPGTGRDTVVSSETDGCPVRETLVAPFSRNARSIFRSHVHSYDRRQVAPLHSIKLKVELPQIIHENEITERKSSVDRSFAIRKNVRTDFCRIQKSFKRSITEHDIVNYLVASRFNENISRWRTR